jgi:hypothetical protein
MVPSQQNLFQRWNGRLANNSYRRAVKALLSQYFLENRLAGLLPRHQERGTHRYARHPSFLPLVAGTR